MSQIRSKNTKPEIIVRKGIHARGLRFRIHDQSLPCKPDIVLKKYKTAIFVNGCFWHGHDKCKYFKLPSTRTKWWTEKIAKTKQRDFEAISLLELQGWTVIVIFECELKNGNAKKTIEKTVEQICKKLA